MPKTDMELPMRINDRSERFDPHCTKSSTESADPIRCRPNTDKELPSLDNFRMDNELPIAK